MSLSGTRGLVRVSKNPECVAQAAMAVDKVKEPDFYRAVTGTVYPGEYGERHAARRRGAKFEANLHQNDAHLLRQTVGPMFGWDPATMVVRDLSLESGGTKFWAKRLVRTRFMLADLAQGKEVPHLVIQPQLVLPAGPGEPELVSPDFMVLDRAAGIYVPGEEKSFITRENVAEPGDLDLTRRQAAAQVLALRAMCSQVAPTIRPRVSNRAVFVFSTPYGLKPAPPHLERLDAEVHEMSRALAHYAKAKQALAALRRNGSAPLEMLFDELPIHFQEGCFGSCIMASVCEQRFRSQAAALGDDAARLLGAETDLRRVALLLAGDTPQSPAEVELIAQIRKAAEALGIDPAELARRMAA